MKILVGMGIDQERLIWFEGCELGSPQIEPPSPKPLN